MPSHPAFRAARSVVFAAVCVTLAVLGHVMASHQPVPPAAAAGGLAGLTVVAAALTGTERSLATILGGLLGGQFMLHAVFSAAQHGQHLEHGAHMGSAASGGAAMTLAHVVAAVVSAWWLRRGERAVWGLAKKIAALMRSALAPPAEPAPLPSAPRVRARSASAITVPAAVLRHVVVRRGPPSPLTALA